MLFRLIPDIYNVNNKPKLSFVSLFIHRNGQSKTPLSLWKPLKYYIVWNRWTSSFAWKPPGAREGLQIAEHLLHVADSSGVIAQYGTNGTIPSWYSNYENNYYLSTFLQGAASDRNLFISLYKSCGEGSIIPMLNTYPIMPPTWKDKVSQIEVVGVFGGASLYGKIFYGRHLGTFYLWGFDRLCFEGTTVDNKMRSGFRL